MPRDIFSIEKNPPFKSEGFGTRKADRDGERSGKSPLVRTAGGAPKEEEKKHRAERILLLRVGGCVEDDLEWGDAGGLGVTVHEEALAVLGDVVSEEIGRGDLRAAVTLE